MTDITPAVVVFFILVGCYLYDVYRSKPSPKKPAAKIDWPTDVYLILAQRRTDAARVREKANLEHALRQENATIADDCKKKIMNLEILSAKIEEALEFYGTNY
jgi:hypothetical protein